MKDSNLVTLAVVLPTHVRQRAKVLAAQAGLTLAKWVELTIMNSPTVKGGE